MSNPDTYFLRSEVSNSDLTSLKMEMNPQLRIDDAVRNHAFAFGTLVDALVTEPDRVNYAECSVDGVLYEADDWERGLDCRDALLREAASNPFLAHVLRHASNQCSMHNRAQHFAYGGFPFALDTRCKWDWWLSHANFGGDLKTTAASSQQEFENAVEFFDWDRSRAWYMDIAHSDRDFIFAVSKKNFKVFSKFICRGDEVYLRGRQKYEELAFNWWLLKN